jgi:hypothetical protein
MILATLLLTAVGNAAGASKDPAKIAMEKMQWMYRTDPTAGMMVDTTKAIFHFGSKHISLTRQTGVKIDKKCTQSSKETSDYFEASFGLEGSYGAFSAAVSSSVALMTSTTHTFSRCDHNIKAEMYKVGINVPVSSLYDLVGKQYKAMLDTGTAKEVVDFFGEFYATEATFGGLVSSIAIVEATEGESSTQVEFNAEASFPMGGVSAGVKSVSANKYSTAETKWQVQILGGDPAPWLKVNSEGDMESAQAEWAETVKDEDLRAVDLVLHPLWTLLEGHNDEQAKKIQQYLESQWSCDKDIFNITDDDMGISASASVSDSNCGSYTRDGKVPNQDTSEVVMRQPAEEKGDYKCRQITMTVKELLDSRDGCWDFDQLTCDGGTRPFKWGGDCYGGRIHLPVGVCAYVIKPGRGSWDNICDGPFTKYEKICGTEIKQDHDRWDYHSRVCAWKFEKEAPAQQVGPVLLV